MKVMTKELQEAQRTSHTDSGRKEGRTGAQGRGAEALKRQRSCTGGSLRKEAGSLDRREGRRFTAAHARLPMGKKAVC